MSFLIHRLITSFELTLRVLFSRNGMIERVRNPKDRRTINIFLTDKARDMRTELMPVAIEVNEVATAGLSDDEFDQFRALLQKVRENLSMEDAD